MQCSSDRFSFVAGAATLTEAVARFKMDFLDEEDLFSSVLDRLDGLAWLDAAGRLVELRFRDMEVDWSSGPYRNPHSKNRVAPHKRSPA